MDIEDDPGVDITLVAMFIDMTPEQRLLANDNAARAILELKHAFRQRRTDGSGSERNS
jgi:hypothetical protein